MKRSDVLEQVSELVAAFGKDGISEDRVKVYVEHLEDIDAALLSATVKAIISGSKFFPSVSEIRETSARIAGVAPALPAEALAIIRLADKRVPIYRRDGSFAYEERYWDWPEMSDATREAVNSALCKAGEPCDGNGNPRFGWETGLQRVYEAEAAVVGARVLADLSHARLPSGEPQKALEGAR